ncbi:hypothetical protein [Pantoea wallisii]|uniref:hypothetical protein n=1 Tax=Pantoea wallisii TaxID=1076551 RepID=UPI00142D50E3|nr:hypothetical protein [Pantoea wallisii]
MRLFNPVTMTEAIPGIHDLSNVIELFEDNWFFTTVNVPEGMVLSVNKDGEPILKEIE